MCVCKRIRAIAKNFFITQCQWMHMNTHIHIYMCGCVCVWVCMHRNTNEIIDKCIYERYQLQTYLHWVQKQKKILSFILVFCTVVDEIFHAKSFFFNNDRIELSRQYHKTANVGARIFLCELLLKFWVTSKLKLFWGYQDLRDCKTILSRSRLQKAHSCLHSKVLTLTKLNICNIIPDMKSNHLDCSLIARLGSKHS